MFAQFRNEERDAANDDQYRITRQISTNSACGTEPARRSTAAFKIYAAAFVRIICGGEV